MDLVREMHMDFAHSRTKGTPPPAVVAPAYSSPDAVNCTNCGAEIKLTEVIARKFEEQAKSRMEVELRRREAALRADAAQELAAAVERTQSQVKEQLATRMSDMEAQIRENSIGMEKARAVELELRRHQRQLEEREKNVKLDMARQVDVERKKAEQQATERVQEEFRLREAATNERLASMTRTIQDLKRKAEQGSQQTQGEAVEVELETVLRHAFPTDGITPVNKGVRGADIVHAVRTPNGADCAAIVWETKNAKAWSPKWLEKVREDQREAKAELAVIVTTTLPPGIRNFGQVEGVWVCDLPSAPVLAVALRAQLVAVHRERVSSDGRSTKETQLYDYVTGTEFRQRVIAAATTLIEMKHDVIRERNSAVRAFAKRDKQIDCAAEQIVALYGGAQGIIGGSLKPVVLLEMPDKDETASNGDDSTELAST
jgi:hypothetical protein